jgi:hypothetical protein
MVLLLLIESPLPYEIEEPEIPDGLVPVMFAVVAVVVGISHEARGAPKALGLKDVLTINAMTEQSIQFKELARRQGLSVGEIDWVWNG